MDGLAREIERQRLRKIEDDALLANTGAAKRKFVKRSSINALKEEEIIKAENERHEKKAKLASDLLGQTADTELILANASLQEEIFIAMDRSEVERRLRSFYQPITYFAESDIERQKRLHQIEMLVHERELGESGQKNTFHAMMNSSIDQEIEDAMAADKNDPEFKSAVTDGDDESDDEGGGAVADTKRPELAGVVQQLQKTRADFEHHEDYVVVYLKRILKEWEYELESRPEAEKRTAQGKFAKATWQQTRQYLKPLFKLLKRRSIDADVAVALDKIVCMCENREYVAANDCYLHLAIGNAPWPMGVSMAGIHERSGRDKLTEKANAHILNDENQRKYIQSVKRLMTYAQHKYPNATNSKNCG